MIVGLGNPGSKYERTRHNAGFLFVDKMREYLGWDKGYDVGDWKEEKKLKSLVCEARTVDGSKVLLAKPQTFVNLSGEAVQKMASMFKIDIEKDLVLVHDDLDLKLGAYKIQLGVSPELHNGINSVEQYLGKTDFLRVRIGVDSRQNVSEVPGDEYVLQQMEKETIELLESTIVDAVKDLRSVISI